MALTEKAMKLNEELSRVIYCKSDIRRLERAIAMSEHDISRSKEIYPTRGQGGFPVSEAQRYAELIDSKNRELEAARIELIESRGVVKSILARFEFEELEEKIFHARYVEGLRWHEVARRAGYAKRHITRLWEIKINDL